MSSRPLDPDAIRAYAARDWARVRENKRAYWRARLDRGGLAEAVRVTELLRDTTAPSETSREEDLETHKRVAEGPRTGHSPRSLSSRDANASDGTCSEQRR